MLTFSTYVGQETLALAPDLASLHSQCLSGWPYFAAKGVNYEAGVLRALAAGGEESLVVVARDGDKIAGATSGSRLSPQLTAIREALSSNSIDPDAVHWITQMTLLPEYRGQGASNTLSYTREDYLRNLGTYSHIVFSSLVRPSDHPLRPADYVPHDGMWVKRGYRHLEGSDVELVFSDSLDKTNKPTAKTLQLWVKDLP